MLTLAGCRYVILGHSERRQYFEETDEGICAKIGQAHAHGLIPIMCVGETLEECKAGKAEEVVGRQLVHSLRGVAPGSPDQLVIAYEPVWAIGTGETATPDQAQEMHAFIRGRADVDGGLIGGVSLKGEDFAAIVRAG